MANGNDRDNSQKTSPDHPVGPTSIDGVEARDLPDGGRGSAETDHHREHARKLPHQTGGEIGSGTDVGLRTNRTRPMRRTTGTGSTTERGRPRGLRGRLTPPRPRAGHRPVRGNRPRTALTNAAAFGRGEVCANAVHHRRVQVHRPPADRHRPAEAAAAEVGHQTGGRDDAGVQSDAEQQGVGPQAGDDVRRRRPIVARQPVDPPTRPRQEVADHPEPDEVALLPDTGDDGERSEGLGRHEQPADPVHQPQRVMRDEVLVAVGDPPALPQDAAGTPARGSNSRR